MNRDLIQIYFRSCTKIHKMMNEVQCLKYLPKSLASSLNFIDGTNPELNQKHNLQPTY